MKEKIRKKMDSYISSILDKPYIDKDDLSALMSYHLMLENEEAKEESKRRQEESDEKLKKSMETMMSAWR